MSHEVFVDDTVVIRRKLEVPACCPKCKRQYNLGDTALKTVTLRPKRETLHLSSLLVARNDKREIVSVKETAWTGAENPRLILEIRCNHCNYLHATAHSRTYHLHEMDRFTAFKLRGLLYDSNAADPEVRSKCYAETEGYHGDCIACNIEADIGTEEVPHPIDVRLHTCKKK